MYKGDLISKPVVYRIVKSYGGKKEWQIPSFKRFGKKILAIAIIIAKVLTAKFF